MAMYFDGATQYGTLPNESLYSNAAAFSYIVYVKPDSGAATEQHIFGGFSTAAISRFSGTVYRGDQATKTLSKYKSNGTVYYGSSATFVPTAGAWNTHFFSRSAAGATAISSRYFVNNSATSVQNTDENAASDINKFGFAARRNASGVYERFFKGKIACVAVWNRQLTSTEEDNLKAGAHPNTISSGLVDIFEWTGTGNPATSTSLNGRVITWVGSPTLDSDSPFPSITNVGTANSFKVGETGISITTAGMSTLTSVSFTDTFSTSTGTGLSAPGGNGTWNAASWVDGGTYPNVGSITFTASDSINTKNTSATLNLPTGFAFQTIVSAVTTDPTYLGYPGYINAPGLPDNTKIYYESANGLVITAEGGIQADGEMVTVIWVHYVYSGGDKKTYSYTVTIDESGVVTSVVRNTSLGIGIKIGI